MSVDGGSGNIRVRLVENRDAEALRTIYNWAVHHSTATMDTTERTPVQQQAWLDAHNGEPYPGLVAETENGTVVGYASLSRYNLKPGYATTTENSVYVHEDWRGRGVGAILLSALLDEAARRGFVTIVALITADNEASLRLHRRFGFEEVGTLRKVGRKFDRWVDVTFMQRTLDEPSQTP